MTEQNAVELVKQLTKTFEEFKSANDQRLDQIEKKGSADVVTVDQTNRINDAVTALDKEVKAAGKKLIELETLAARPGSHGGDAKAEFNKKHAELFSGYLRKGLIGRAGNQLLADLQDLEQKNNMSTLSDPDGGWLIPEEYDAQIGRVVASYSAMRSLATVTPVNGNTLKEFISKGGATGGWVQEGGTVSATNTPQLAKFERSVGKMYAYPKTTQEILDDSGLVNAAQWLVEEVAVTFGETEGSAFISGDGVIGPKGFLSETMVVNSSYAWGKIGHTITGAAADFDSGSGKFPLDAFISCLYSLKRQYRANATWLMNDTNQGKVRTFRDANGQYLWQPAAVAGQPNLLLGKPVETDDFMPDVGSNTFPVAIADWKRAYRVVDKPGITVVRDNVTSPGYVIFWVYKRVGGGVRNYEAIKLLKCST